MTAAPAIPSEGWGVLHLYYGLIGSRREAVDLAAAEALIEVFRAEPDSTFVAFSVLGQRAELGFLVIAPDFARLQRLQRELEATALGERLDPRPDLSFLSITEASEYLVEDGSGRFEAMREARLHPRGLTKRRVLCFYPMSKRRDVGRNWYTLSFDERRALMGGHGRTGATFRDRIVQMITAATGLTDWEWGVTLFADDIKAIKDVVYEMRYDAASAEYAEFGPFTVGLVADLRGAVTEAGQTVA
jgi:chlorite dismutase